MSYHLFSSTERTAQKEHRCIWCGEAIPVGSKYFDERSVYDGHRQTHRWHSECLGAAQEEFRKWGDGEFLPYSNERPEVAPAEEAKS